MVGDLLGDEVELHDLRTTVMSVLYCSESESESLYSLRSFWVRESEEVGLSEILCPLDYFLLLEFREPLTESWLYPALEENMSASDKIDWLEPFREFKRLILTPSKFCLLSQ